MIQMLPHVAIPAKNLKVSLWIVMLAKPAIDLPRSFICFALFASVIFDVVDIEQQKLIFSATNAFSAISGDRFFFQSRAPFSAICSELSTLSIFSPIGSMPLHSLQATIFTGNMVRQCWIWTIDTASIQLFTIIGLFPIHFGVQRLQQPRPSTIPSTFEQRLSLYNPGMIISSQLAQCVGPSSE
jgi:hypothetical protein